MELGQKVEPGGNILGPIIVDHDVRSCMIENDAKGRSQYHILKKVIAVLVGYTVEPELLHGNLHFARQFLI